MSNTIDWKKFGDNVHILVVANTFLFAIAVVVYNSSDIFDSLWRPDGFCVSNKNVPYWNSHDLCLYFDTIGAIVIGFTYYMMKDKPGMEPANEMIKFNIFGIFAHGLGHGVISKALRDGAVPEVDGDRLQEIFNSPTNELLTSSGGIVLFWLGLLKATMPKSSFKVYAPLSLIATVLNILVPERFGFTFVQTVLLLSFSINQLMRPSQEKTFEYALYPLITGLPLSFIGWFESTQCSKFVINIGGHLIYDAYIPVSMMCFYLICWKNTTQKIKKA